MNKSTKWLFTLFLTLIAMLFIFINIKSTNDTVHTDTAAQTAPAAKIQQISLPHDTSSSVDSFLPHNNKEKTLAIKTCEKEQNNLIPRQIIEDYPEASSLFDRNKLLQLLSSSDVLMEAEVAYALMSENDFSANSHPILDAFLKYPESKLLAYYTLLICNSIDCEPKTIAQALLTDHDNGASWLAYTNLVSKHNNFEAVLTALDNASNATTYNEYILEKIDIYEQAMLQFGYVDHELIALSSIINLQGHSSPGFGILESVCSNATPDDISLIDSCLTIGQRLSQSKNTLISSAIGTELQINMYQKLNDETALEFLNENSLNHGQLLRQYLKASNVIWYNRLLFSEFIEVLKNSNEVEATKHLIKTALAVSAEPNFDPCQINW